MAAERFALRASRPVDPRSTTWFKKEPAIGSAGARARGTGNRDYPLCPTPAVPQKLAVSATTLAFTQRNVPEHAQNARSHAGRTEEQQQNNLSNPIEQKLTEEAKEEGRKPRP
jgi:hypothetical protein